MKYFTASLLAIGLMASPAHTMKHEEKKHHHMGKNHHMGKHHHMKEHKHGKQKLMKKFHEAIDKGDMPAIKKAHAELKEKREKMMEMRKDKMPLHAKHVHKVKKHHAMKMKKMELWAEMDKAVEKGDLEEIKKVMAEIKGHSPRVHIMKPNMYQ